MGGGGIVLCPWYLWRVVGLWLLDYIRIPPAGRHGHWQLMKYLCVITLHCIAFQDEIRIRPRIRIPPASYPAHFHSSIHRI